MSQRGLSAGAITALGASPVEFYHLLRIDYSTPLYYTTAPYNISYGGNTYLSSVVLLTVPDIVESLDIKPGRIELSLSGALLDVHTALLSEAQNADVYVYRYIIATSEAITLFKGFTDGYSIDEDTRGEKVDIRLGVSNHWSNWEAEAGRYLSDATQQRLYPGDLGMAFYRITDFFIDFWGVPSVNGASIDAQLGIPGAAFGLGSLIYYFNQAKASALANPERVKLPVLYGQKRVAGVPVFRTLVNNNTDMWVVYAVAEGDCDSLIDITFDGISYTDAKLSPYISVVFHSGTTTQAADSALDTASALWTSNHRLRGICYVVIKYIYNKDAWPTDPQPLFEIKGKKLYDPRTTTTAYSTNNALVLYDYLTSVAYGKGIAAADLDGINAGADYCDSVNTDHDGGEGGTPISLKLFEFNGALDLGNSVKKNAEAILYSMRAHLPWISGKYTLVIERHDDTSVFAFNSDHFGGKFTTKEAGIRDLANIVYYNVVDADDDSTSIEVIADSASYLAADGRELRLDISNRFETNRYRAQNRAATELKKTRQQVSVSFNCINASALQVQTGQVVDITRSTKGWVNKEFRVTDMKLLADGGLSFDCDEYEPTVYDWNVSTETAPPANTTLPNPLDIAAPTSMVLESGTNALIRNSDGTIVSRIKATFAASADAFVRGYNVYIKKPTDATKLFYARVEDPATTELYISPVEDGISYTVYIAAYNRLGAESALLSGSTTVIGKTAVPANVTGFIAAQNGEVVVMKWTQVTDVDLAGYEIRFGKRGNTSWADGTPLTSVTRGTNVTSADIPPGDWTLFIKAVDTSGNYSTTAAQVNLVITTAQDVIYQQEASPDWAGTLTNFVRHHTGVLAPQSQNLASDDGWETFDQFVVNPYATCSYEDTEIDIAFDDDVRVWGDISSALGPGETTGVADPALQIDYRTAAGSYDGFESWSIGNVNLRYCKHKLVLDTTKGIAKITGFMPTVDLLEHTISAQDVAVGSGGSTITFAEQFHVAPFVRVFVKGTAAQYAVINNITTTGFDVQIYNTSGTGVAGTIDWEAEGV